MVESLELDAHDINKKICGVIQLWAYAETVAVGREKQKLRRAPPPAPRCAFRLSCFVRNHFPMILHFRSFLLNESQIS